MISVTLQCRMGRYWRAASEPQLLHEPHSCMNRLLFRLWLIFTDQRLSTRGHWQQHSRTIPRVWPFPPPSSNPLEKSSRNSEITSSLCFLQVPWKPTGYYAGATQILIKWWLHTFILFVLFQSSICCELINYPIKLISIQASFNILLDCIAWNKLS